MPRVNVTANDIEREKYLAQYRTQGIGRLDERMVEIWTLWDTTRPWEMEIANMRAMQGFSYLIDPDRDNNIERYRLIDEGLISQPGFGATREEVAKTYVESVQDIALNFHRVVIGHKNAVMLMTSTTSTDNVDTLVNNFIASTQWIFED